MDKKEITKVMAFMSMSDGCLTLHDGCVNASFHVSMCNRNADMAEFLTPYLKAIGVGFSYKEGEKYFTLRTRVHPFLTQLYERIYSMGRRVPSHHDFKLLDWQAMAILYMCDGNIQRGGSRMYPMLNLCRWSYPELCWVKVQVKDTLGLDLNIYKCGKYWRLGVPARHCDMFFANVRPFMLPSFSYKLPYGEPQVGTLGGEIVRPVGKPSELGGNDLAFVTM